MKLDLKEIQQINLFENITGSKVKNCYLEEDKMVFIVEENNVKRALGVNNSNIKKLQNLFKKKIKIIGFSSDLVKFINNLLYPIKPENIENKDDIVYITAKDNFIKGKIYGRGKENLKKIKETVSKYFKIKDIIIQ